MGEIVASITIHIDPVIFQLGPIAPRWYGLMYVVGLLAGIWVARPYANQQGVTNEQIETLVGPAIIAGLIGGRLYYVVQQPLEPFLREPIRIIAIWEGGMAFYGAIFGTVLALIITCRVANIPLWPILDAVAIFAVVGQFFGRIGNVINGDIVGPPVESVPLFGLTDLPWGFIYTHPNSFPILRGDGPGPYHPAAIYEMLSNIVVLLILWNLRWRVPKTGMIFALYLIGYSVTQFVVFFLRIEPKLFLGLQQAQLTAILVFYFGVLLFMWVWRRGEPLAATSGEQEKIGSLK